MEIDRKVPEKRNMPIYDFYCLEKNLCLCQKKYCEGL